MNRVSPATKAWVARQAARLEELPEPTAARQDMPDYLGAVVLGAFGAGMAASYFIGLVLFV